MRKGLLIIVIVLVCLFSISITSATNNLLNLIIIGWDGTGLKNVNRLLAENKLPNLQYLLNSRSCIVPLELIGRTNTITSWVLFFTGLTYDLTGVLGNKLYQDVIISKKYDRLNYIFPSMDFWLKVIPYSNTIIEPIQKNGCKIGWFTSKKYLGKNRKWSPLAKIAENADGFILRKPKHFGDDYIWALTDEAIQFINDNDNFLIFLHLNPDYYGHRYSSNSQRYEDEFIRCDEALGRLLDYINLDEVGVMIISDHGFDENSKHHYNAPDAWMATNLPVHSSYCQQIEQRAFATIRDMANTVLKFYGIDDKKIPQMRGKSLLE